MPMIGTSGFILIAAVALVLFGPKKLPELGKAFGQTLREFKSGTKDLLAEEDNDKESVKLKEGTNSTKESDLK